MKRQKLRAFHTLLRELRVSDRTVTNINEHSGFVAKKCWIIWVRIKIIMGYVSIADRRTLVSIWSQDRKRSQTIANGLRSGFPYDCSRSQNFLRSTICDSRSSAIIWKPALKTARNVWESFWYIKNDSKDWYYDILQYRTSLRTPWMRHIVYWSRVSVVLQFAFILWDRTLQLKVWTCEPKGLCWRNVWVTLNGLNDPPLEKNQLEACGSIPPNSVRSVFV